MTELTITGLILAGGRGARMGGIDKGLQNFNGTPLSLHTLLRLQMQEGAPLSEIMIVANRNLSAYESLGVQVWPDSTDGFAGPLAGFLTGLERCETSLLLTVPCDSPLFPMDLVQRLTDALISENADIAMAAAKEEDGKIRPQPVFCLMRVSLLESLVKFITNWNFIADYGYKKPYGYKTGYLSNLSFVIPMSGFELIHTETPFITEHKFDDRY
jgi:molybdopterin-guanine dinucleotide biosynthesis protein A